MSAASVNRQLRGHLATLRLAAAAEALPVVLEEAAAERLGQTAMPERLLAIEVAATTARRRTSLERLASLPAPWRPADPDFEAQPPRRAGHGRRAGEPALPQRMPPTSCPSAHRGWARRCSRWASGAAAVAAGHRTYHTTAAELAARCYRAAIEGRWATTMRSYTGAPSVDHRRAGIAAPRDRGCCAPPSGSSPSAT